MASKSHHSTLKTLPKSLKYSVVTTFINFNPDKHRPQTIIVDGSPAVHLKGRVYTQS